MQSVTRLCALAVLIGSLLLSIPHWAIGATPYTDLDQRGPYDVTSKKHNYGDKWCKLTVNPTTLECREIPCQQSSREHDIPTVDVPNTGFPVELAFVVHYPVIKQSASASTQHRPFPLIFLLHGGHVTCYDDTAVNHDWPCKTTQKSIPSYEGFDYLGDVLASYGYIVVSISANGIKAFEESDLREDVDVIRSGRSARVQLIQEHIGLWKTFNGPRVCEPFDDLFHAKVELSTIGLMGHSLGGEAVVAYQNEPLEYPAKAILALAPYYRSPLIAIRGDVSFALMMPYCDGDLINFQGINYFDNVWYNSENRDQYDEKKDKSPRHLALVLGANHNYYNTIWTPGLFPAGTVDDWVSKGPGGIRQKGPDPQGTDPYCGSVAFRLTAAQQRDTGIDYITPFFRYYLGGEIELRPVVNGDQPVSTVNPTSAMKPKNRILVSYHAPDPIRSPDCQDPHFETRDGNRLDVNRLLHERETRFNTLCGCVRTSNVNLQFIQKTTVAADQNDKYPERQSLSQFRLQWGTQSKTAAKARPCDRNDRPEARRDVPWYRNDMPEAYRDVSGFRRLQFRVGVDFTSQLNPNACEPDFSVELSDGLHTASVSISDWSRALYFPPGSQASHRLRDPLYPVPKVVLNMVSLPLIQAFQKAKPQLNLQRIHSVTFKFDRTDSGDIFISDIAFSK